MRLLWLAPALLLFSCGRTVLLSGGSTASLKDTSITDRQLAKDAGSEDRPLPDNGSLDTGQTSDATVFDSGPPTACQTGTEGCACGRGGQCDPQLECRELPSGQSVCIRPCQSDGDCRGSIHRLCRRWRVRQLACVSEEVQTGLQTHMRRTEQRPMTGCSLESIVLDATNAHLDGLGQNEGSCALVCDRQNACPLAQPFCNPFVHEDVAGVCSLRRAQVGDICSRTSAVGLCDTSAAPFFSGRRVLCVDPPFSVDQQTRLEGLDQSDPTGDSQLSGICIVTCRPGRDEECAFASDPGVGPARCLPYAGQAGVCSHDCGLFPNSCRRPGSFELGSTCSGDPQFNSGTTFCLDVTPPPLPEVDFTGPPPPNGCRTEPGGPRRCVAGTVCVDDQGQGVCIRTCDPFAMTSGCELSPVTNRFCSDQSQGGPGNIGVCVPPM